MPAVNEILHLMPPAPSIGDTQATCYLLVDGVMLPDALPLLYRAPGITGVTPIYQNTRFDPCKNLGPILVDFAPEAATLEEVLTHIPDWPRCASVLHSGAPWLALCDHLKSFIAPPFSNGSTALLRFADPLVTRFWLGSYTEPQMDSVLGPIAAWHVLEPPHTWLPDLPSRWHSFAPCSAQAQPCNTHNHLRQAQIDALEQSWRWRFMEQLHACLQYTYPDLLARLESRNLVEWFDRRLDEANQWGLSSARGLAIWIEYSLRWGEDFTQRHDSPYQRWLSLTPNAPRLTPQQRIEQMDADCLNTELDKDTL